MVLTNLLPGMLVCHVGRVFKNLNQNSIGIEIHNLVILNIKDFHQNKYFYSYQKFKNKI